MLCRVLQLIKGRSAQVDEAVRLLQKVTGPITDTAVGMYKKLTRRVIGRTMSEEAAGDFAATVAALKEVLYRLANLYRGQSSGRSLNAEMEEILMATHYMHMFLQTKVNGLKDPSVKAAVTLMKYPDIVPQDKAFYLAGNAARNTGNSNLAFMLLNK